MDPNGGAARNRWGYYYSQDQLAMANFFKPTDPLAQDDIFFLHYDGRFIHREAGESSRSFPMAHEVSARGRVETPFLDLSASYSKVFMGRIGGTPARDPSGERMELTKWGIQVDALPMNLYLRAGQGQPIYGLRRPNHTLWIRERLGLDQFALASTYSIGGSPNVPFFHVASHLGDPRLEEAKRQKGYTYHLGVRGVTLGWNLNASGWKTESAETSIDMTAFGFGANILGIIVYGESNFRKVKSINNSIGPTRLHPSSQISELSVHLDFIDGVMPGYIRETMLYGGAYHERSSFTLDLHLVPNLQIEFWKRYESRARSLEDFLAIVHLYADI